MLVLLGPFSAKTIALSCSTHFMDLTKVAYFWRQCLAFLRLLLFLYFRVFFFLCCEVTLSFCALVAANAYL